MKINNFTQIYTHTHDEIFMKISTTTAKVK